MGARSDERGQGGVLEGVAPWRRLCAGCANCGPDAVCMAAVNDRGWPLAARRCNQPIPR